MTDFYEWAHAEPRALARFVRPQDLTAEFRLPGYINRLDLLQAEGPQGVAGALYRAIARQALQYDLSPFDPRAGVVQKIRTPATILREGRATCLDLAVLVAAACLENDLLSIIVALEGHALVGVSLGRTRRAPGRAPKALAWDRGLLDDLEVLQELLGAEYLLIEGTGLVRSQSLSADYPEGQGREAGGTFSFERACVAGAEQVIQALAPDASVDGKRRRFLYALDIHDLQVNQGFAPEEGQMADEDEKDDGVALRSGRSVQIGGQTNRDVIINGDVTGRNRITTTIDNSIHTGDLRGNTGLALGHGASATVQQGAAAADLAAAFARVYQTIETRPVDPKVDKEEIEDTVKRIEKETAEKGPAADEGRLERWVKSIGGMAPDILEVMASAFGGPVSAAGTILKKVIERAKSQAG